MKSLLEVLSLSEEKITFVPDRPGHDFRYAINIQKLLKLGWKPKKDIKKDLKDTVNWYIDNSTWWSDSYKEIIEKRKKRFNLY